MKKTFNEIIDKLKEVFGDNESGVSSFAFGNHPDGLYEKYKHIEDYEQRYKIISDEIGLGEWKEVGSYGGEGMGETWYRVYYFKDHDIYIRVDGFYSSYNGTDFYDGWNCCRKVKPESRTITVYE